jgi:hypothetical protein
MENKGSIEDKDFYAVPSKGVILTKDNLVCNWQGSENCYFRHQNETMKHLFMECRFGIGDLGLHTGCVNSPSSFFLEKGIY